MSDIRQDLYIRYGHPFKRSKNEEKYFVDKKTGTLLKLMWGLGKHSPLVLPYDTPEGVIRQTFAKEAIANEELFAFAHGCFAVPGKFGISSEGTDLLYISNFRLILTSSVGSWAIPWIYVSEIRGQKPPFAKKTQYFCAWHQPVSPSKGQKYTRVFEVFSFFVTGEHRHFFNELLVGPTSARYANW